MFYGPGGSKLTATINLALQNMIIMISMSSHLATLALAFMAFPASAIPNLVFTEVTGCSSNSTGSSQFIGLENPGLGWNNCLNMTYLHITNSRLFYTRSFNFSDPDILPLASRDSHITRGPACKFFIGADDCNGDSEYTIALPNDCLDNIPSDRQSMSLYCIPNAIVISDESGPLMIL
jgi:hypothetical protein